MDGSLAQAIWVTASLFCVVIFWLYRWQTRRSFRRLLRDVKIGKAVGPLVCLPCSLSKRDLGKLRSTCEAYSNYFELSAADFQPDSESKSALLSGLRALAFQLNEAGFNLKKTEEHFELAVSARHSYRMSRVAATGFGIAFATGSASLLSCIFLFVATGPLAIIPISVIAGVYRKVRKTVTRPVIKAAGKRLDVLERRTDEIARTCCELIANDYWRLAAKRRPCVLIINSFEQNRTWSGPIVKQFLGHPGLTHKSFTVVLAGVSQGDELLDVRSRGLVIDLR